MERIAIIGHGKLGAALGRRALRHGLEVTFAGRRDAGALQEIVGLAAPGARTASVQEAVRGADLSVLALPIGAYSALSAGQFAGRTVVDAMNAYAPIELAADECANRGAATSSEVVQQHLADALVVKTLNHIGYHDLDTDVPAEAPLLGRGNRRAVALASDHPTGLVVASALVRRLGFDPVDAGALRMGESFEPGTPAFAQPMDEQLLRFALAAYDGPARHRQPTVLI